MTESGVPRASSHLPGLRIPRGREPHVVGHALRCCAGADPRPPTDLAVGPRQLGGSTWHACGHPV